MTRDASVVCFIVVFLTSRGVHTNKKHLPTPVGFWVIKTGIVSPGEMRGELGINTLAFVS